MATFTESQSKTCKSLEQDLVLYHYGELGAEERAHIEAHLTDCASCRASLEEMSQLLPMTVLPDAPPQTFWDSYSRELRSRLAAAPEKISWREKLGDFFQHWTLPALATTAVIALALTLTMGKGLWRAKDAPPDDEVFMETLPVAEDLEFFQTMEMLDALELLELMGGQGDGKA